MTPTQQLMRDVRREALAPPPKLLISDFAANEIIVTSGPRAGMRWSNDFAPYQRGIMDALLEPGVEFVAVMGSSQWGKTACATNVVAYFIAHDPCPALVVLPTVDPMAREFAKNRLGTVIEASPILRDRVATTHARDHHGSTTLMKVFPGGALSIGGANSAASLSARSVRLLVLDEIERFPHELDGEGNTIEIALKRTLAFQPRRKILLLSSPKLVGGPIDRWFQRGDRRYYYVPCPGCGHMDRIRWRNLHFDDHDPTTARLVCAECRVQWGDVERIASLARGEWRAEKPDRADRRIVSFHLWEGYSPLSSLREIVRTFLAARQAQREGDRSVMHAWQNTTLGEPVEVDAGDGIEPHVLLLRREQYPEDIDVPAGACCLTAGVDVQDDRLEALVIGWGAGEESWLVDRQTLPGDTSQPQPWAMLDELLDADYRHPTGLNLRIHSMCIDSAGHRTDLVYAYCQRQAARRVYATIGRDGERPIVSSPSPRRWGRTERPVPLYTIGVDTAKALVMSRLALTEKGRGFVHIPNTDWADEELAAQLASERLVTKWSQGVPQTFWKKTRARNEMLDAFVLGLAALRLLNPRLDAMAARLAAAGSGTTGAAAQSPPRAPGHRVIRSNYITGGTSW
jgi:phage terminase large subunit GpA-like protein